MKTYLKCIANVFWSRSFHVAVHTALLVIITGLIILANGEDRLYDTAVHNIVRDTMTQEEKVIALNNAAHELVSSQNKYIAHIRKKGIRSMFFDSGDLQLASGGACGSFSHVLGRLLHQAEIPFRIIQMQCHPDSGACHILVEAKVDEDWVVLDPLFNLYFPTSTGLATFSEVKQNWGYYKTLTPPNYRMMYDYQHMRRTNWDKVPFIMPIAQKIVSLFADPKQISLRSHVLNLYRAYAYALLFIEALLIFGTGIWFYQNRL